MLLRALNAIGVGNFSADYIAAYGKLKRWGPEALSSNELSTLTHDAMNYGLIDPGALTPDSTEEESVAFLQNRLKGPSLRLWFSGGVLWLLVAAIAIVIPLHILFPEQQLYFMTFGYASGVLLSLSGTIVCGSTVTISGAAAGGIFIAAAFGIVNTMLVQYGGGAAQVIELLSRRGIDHDIIGGIPGLVQPNFWMVSLIVIAICFCSLFMATEARSVHAKAKEMKRKWSVFGFLAAVCVGGLIPVIQSLQRTLASAGHEISTFGLIFGIVGGGAFAAITVVRKKSMKLVWIGLPYLIGVYFLTHQVFDAHLSPEMRLCLAGMSTAIFHGTFFTLTYALGDRIGGRWAGAIASAISGTAGFVGFLIHIHGGIRP